MFSRILAGLVGLAGAAFLAVAVWPELVGYQRVWPFAILVAMRGLAILAAIILIFAFLVLGRLGRWLRRSTSTLIVLLILFVGANTWILVTRGFDNAQLTPEDASDITVLAWNTMGGSPAPLAIANLALDSDADIVALPETTQQTASGVLGILDSSGKRMTLLTDAFDTRYDAHSTALLISKDLGDYALALDVGNTVTAPSLVARPVSGEGPTIVATHVSAPSPGSMSAWRTDISWLADICSMPNVIVAGDFNGSVDNFTGTGDATLGGCADVARVTNSAALGTWPTWVPAFVGAPIDHVMFRGPYVATEFHVYENPAGSRGDHRPIVARLTREGG